MRKPILLALAVATAILVIVHVTGSGFIRPLERVLHPTGKWFYNVGVGLRVSTTEFSRSLFSGSDEELQRELTQLRLQLIEKNRLIEQNQQLREELGFLNEVDYDLLAANIVNYQPDGARDMIRIDVGSEHGIESGMPILSQGVLLGVTEEAHPQYSSVVLVSDINFRALVEVEGVSGVLSGQVGRGLVVESLPRNRGISEGSLVVTSGDDGVYPPGLLVGEVRSLAQTQGGVFDRAQVAPEVSARDLQAVMVLRQ